MEELTRWTTAAEADDDGQEEPAVAPARIGPASTIRGALTVGFAVVFALWGASGDELVRSLRDVDRRLDASRDDCQRGQDVLATVRSNVLLGSIYLRDAPIDRTPASDDDYRSTLQKVRDDVERVLPVDVPLLGSPIERQHGRGIAAAARASDARRRLGLIGMRARAQALAGTFVIENRTEGGTRVTVRLPAPIAAEPPAAHSLAG